MITSALERELNGTHFSLFPSLVMPSYAIRIGAAALAVALCLAGSSTLTHMPRALCGSTAAARLVFTALARGCVYFVCPSLLPLLMCSVCMCLLLHLCLPVSASCSPLSVSGQNITATLYIFPSAPTCAGSGSPFPISSSQINTCTPPDQGETGSNEFTCNADGR